MPRGDAAGAHVSEGAPTGRGVGDEPGRPDTLRFFDRAGNPVGREAWQELSTETSYVQLARDVRRNEGGEVEIVTFWLGLSSPPREPHPFPVFRTLMDGLMANGRCLMWAWDSEQAAMAGHAALLNWVDETGADPSKVPDTVSRGAP